MSGEFSGRLLVIVELIKSWNYCSKSHGKKVTFSWMVQIHQLKVKMVTWDAMIPSSVDWTLF